MAATSNIVSSAGVFGDTNSVALATNNVALTPPPLPDFGSSLLNVLGALAIVIAIFLAAIWLFRNWQRLTLQRGRAAKLNVMEVRPLGGRHALYVIGYEQERFLLAASPAGVNLLTHLPQAEAAAPDSEPTSAAPTAFAQTLAKMLKGPKQ